MSKPLVWRSIFLASLLLACAGKVSAGGALVVDTAGGAVRWNTTGPVPYHTDQGALGLFSNSDAVQMVSAFFNVWEQVPTATIAYQLAGDLGVDVNDLNFGSFLGPFGGIFTPLGQSAIVFDVDGAIFDTLFGTGTGVLGFASPTFMSDGVTTVPYGGPVPAGAEIIEGLAFLNGKFIDGVDEWPNREISLGEFEAVFIHEFGHFSGLDHTQIHGLSGPPGSTILRTQPVETMFPFLVDEGEKTLERDDVVSISTLYPTAGFLSSTGRITGRILTSDGALFSGANVIAWNTADGSDAVSDVSGARIVDDGEFSLSGLTPGESYRVEVQEIDVFHQGGSRVGPFSPPRTLPGPPEFYSGGGESNQPADDPEGFEAIVVSAGETVADVEILLNRQYFSVQNVFVDGNRGPTDFAVEDFDGDGVRDFVAPTMGRDPGNLVRFYRGLGDGSFAAPLTIDPLFNSNRFVVAGQFNVGVDSFRDVAVASANVFGPSEVRVYLGNGAGGFGTPTTVLATSDTAPFVDLAIGDLNGDAFTDLVTVAKPFESPAATVYALLGGASGSFAVVETTLAPEDDFPASKLAIGQFAGSTANDVVGSAYTVKLVVLVGDGAGGFAPTVIDLAAVSQRLGLPGAATGDFDEDGNQDIAISDLTPVGGLPNFNQSSVDLFLGDGAGGFEFSQRYQVAEPFQDDIVAADVNGDGHLDLASTGSRFGAGGPGAKLNVVFGDGTGGLSGVTTVWGLAEFPRIIAGADFDGNGLTDLLVSVSQAGSFWADPTATYAVLLQKCGDGSIDPSEQCDDAGESAVCESDCTLVSCGDGTTNATAGEQCDDGNTSGGDCCSSTCQLEQAGSSCDDGNVCTSTSQCDATGLCQGAGHNTSPCDDGDACTTNDTCSGGSCFGGPASDCNDGNICTNDSCDPATGCVNTSNTNTCDDGDRCSTGDTCVGGVCVGTPRPGCIDHFLCYKTRARQEIDDPTLNDLFDNSSYQVRWANMLCLPANNGNEGIVDPDTHLMAYRIRGLHQRQARVEVTNQFGTLYIGSRKAETLMVPTSKSVRPAPPPGPPDPASLVDHYRCLKARKTRGTGRFIRRMLVGMEDQFGSGNVFLKKPSRLCVPTNKDGEGIKSPEAYLMCYKARRLPSTSATGVQVSNQFGEATIDLKRAVEICVPSQVVVPSTSTTTTTTTVP